MNLRTLLVLSLALPSLSAVAKPKPAPAPAPVSKDEELARSYYKAGMDLYETGKFLEAAQEFERALGKAPKQAAFMYNIATAYDKGGDRPKAIEWYRKYVDAVPDAKEVWVSRSRLQVLEKEQAEIDAAKKASAAPAAAKPRAPSLPFVEQVTKYTYQTEQTLDGKAFTLVGAGTRKYYGFKVYAMGLYVEEDPARAEFPKLAAQAGGSDHETLMHSDLAAKFVVLGDFGKAALLHFVRDVKADDTRKSYRESLADTFSDKAPSDLRRDGEAFLALFDDVKEGDNLWIHTTPQGQIVVEEHGKKKVGPTNLRLTHDIWDIWLGAKPISGDLKKTILDRIDVLGR